MPELLLRTMMDSQIEVDREAGVIRNVAVITAGTTKTSANGKGPVGVDGVTLQQVAGAINASETGIKSRLTHPEVSGLDDINLRVGYIRNARIVGMSVRGDMHFHDPSSTNAITLMDIAENDPASAGLSIADFDAQFEPSNESETGIAIRVDTLDAVDWVGEPAANPAGMLSALNVKPGVTLMKGIAMNEKQKDFLRGVGLPFDATDEQTADFIEALSDDQKAQFAALKEDPAVEAAADAAESVSGAVEPSDDKDESPSGLTASAARSQELVNQQVQIALAADRERTNKIHGIALRCGYDQAWINDQIDSNKPIEQIALSAVSTLKRSPADMQSSQQVYAGADLNRDTLNEAVQDAIMLRAGVKTFAKFDDAGIVLSANNKVETRKPHDRAREFRGHSLIEMGRRYLISLGYREADRLNRTELASLLMSRSKLQSVLSGVYLAQSTGDFPSILSDTMGKRLRQEYQMAPHIWDRFTRTVTAPDFKDIKPMQLSEVSNLDVIPEGDDYKFKSLSDGKESYALQTLGTGLKLTRQAMINDDLNAFDKIPQRMGIAAMRAVESAVINILILNEALSDSNALFGSAHANITTGSLSVSSLGAGKALMRKQTSLGSNDPLDLEAAFLIVPSDLETTAMQLIGSPVDPSLSNATPNPHQNKMEVLQTARLSANSTTQWYLSASPAAVDTIEVAFLEGEETPVVEEEDEFNSDARKMKVRHTFKAKAIDHRGLVRSSGV